MEQTGGHPSTLSLRLHAILKGQCTEVRIGGHGLCAKNIPAYERANEQLNQVSKKWQAEVEALNTEAATMYKNYQNEMVFLSQEQKKAKQEQIMQKEKEAADLKQKYFGPEGELFKKRESLMTPIQEEIYNAVKDISELRGYSLVLDRASDTAIIFGSPKIDISDEVLQKLGYGK